MKRGVFGACLIGFAGLLSLPAEAGDIRGKAGKCIDIPNGETKPGTRVHYWPCDGSPEQQWTLQGGQIRGKDGVCLDVPNGAIRDGARVHVWTCAGSVERKWELVDGQIRLGGKCLDLPDGATKDGTPIQLWPCDGSPEQRWQFAGAGQGAAAAAAPGEQPPSAAHVVGRVMSLLVHAEVCKISVGPGEIDALVTEGERLQKKAGLSEAQMEEAGNAARKVAAAQCDAARVNFAKVYQDTMAQAAAIR